MTFRRRALFLAGLFVAVSCSDAGNPLAPPTDPTPRPVPADGIAMDCQLSVPTGELSCQSPTPGTGGALGDIIVGGQDVKVRLVASNHVFRGDSTDAAPDTMEIDVTVQNLMRQALGTTDGTTLDPEGVRLFFSLGPIGQPTGSVTVDNAATGMFTTGEEYFFQYDTILQPDSVSAPLTWIFAHSTSVELIRFRILVQAAVQFPDGFIEVTPRADTLASGETVPLSYLIYTAESDTLVGTPAWSTSDEAIATVDAGGVVTGTGTGTATITAAFETSPGDSVRGSAVIIVNDAPVVLLDTVAAVANVTVPRPAGRLLAKASDPAGETLTVVPDSVGSVQEGSVIIEADGSFTYLSKAGFSGEDSFQFQVTDGVRTATGTMVVDVHPSRYWFVRADAAEGDGRDRRPFGTIAEAQAVAVENDSILVLEGGSPLDEEVVLKSGQGIIGAGIADTLFFHMSPTDSVPVLIGGLMPGLTRGTAGNTVTLAQDNTVAGLGISAAAGAAIAGNDFGTLTTRDLAVNPAGPALLLQDGALDARFITLSSTGSATHGLSLTNVSGLLDAPLGTLAPASDATGRAVLVDSSSARIRLGADVSGTRGIEITGVVADSVTLSGTLNLTGEGIAVHDNPGGVVSFTSTTDKELSTGAAAAVSLTANAAGNVVRFAGGDLHITTTTGAGFTASGPGEVAVTSADGDNAISTGTGTGLSLDGTNTGAQGITFARVSTTGAPSGIHAASITGAGLQVTGAGGDGGTIDTPTGRGIELMTTGSARVELTSLSVTGAGAGGNAGFYADGADSVVVTSVSVAAAGGPALSVSNGRLYGDFALLTSQGSASSGVILSNMAGRFAAAAGTIQNAASTGFAVAGGTVRAFYAGGITQTANAAPLVSVAGHGTSALDSLGFSGALSATLGTGLQFNDAGGTYVFDGTAALAGGDAGIDVENGSTGTFDFRSGVSVADAAGELIRVVNSAPTFTYGGSFTRTTGNATGVLVQDNTGGTITFNGDGTALDADPADVSKSLSTGSAPAVSLIGNTATTILFSGGGLAASTTAGTAFSASGAGTVSVTGAGNQLSTAGGTALSLSSVGTGASGVSFASVAAAAGSAGGIVLSGLSGAGVQVSGGTVQGTTGAAVSLTNLTGLSGPVTLNGMTLSRTAGAGAVISGSTFGTLAVSGTSVSATGGPAALDLSTGTVTGSFSTVSGSGFVAHGVSLNAVGGTWNVGSGGAVAGGSAGAAINLTGNPSTAGTLTWGGNLSQGNNQPLVNVNGHSNGTLTVTGTAGATTGTGLQFTNADGTYNFNGTLTLGGGDAGIDVLSNSTGTFSFPTGSITNPSGPALFVDASAPTLSLGASISTNSGRPVHIEDLTGGSITISGSINASGAGILVQNNTSGSPSIIFSGTRTLTTGGNAAVTLDNNDAATLTFGTAAMTITTSSGAGFRAVNGGTVNVTGTSNDVTSTASGTPVTVDNTTIGGGGFNLRSVTTTSGAANGIVLNNTGAGTLTVAGNGGTCTVATPTCTGGHIASTTGAGVSLTSARASLTRLRVRSTQSHGIMATGASNLTLTSSYLQSNGNGDDENGLHLLNVAGTVLVDNSSFNGAAENLIRVDNNNANLTFTVQNSSSFEYPNPESSPFRNSAILITPKGSSAVTASVTGSTFRNIPVSSFQYGPDLSSTATGSVTFSNNTLSADAGLNVSCGSNPQCRVGNISVGGTGGTTNFVATGNDFNRVNGDGVFILGANQASTLRTRIETNTISNALDDAFVVGLGQSARVIAQFNGNTINNIGADVLEVASGEVNAGYGAGSASDMDLVFTNNSMNTVGTNSSLAATGGPGVFRFGDADQQLCLAFTGNSMSGPLPTTGLKVYLDGNFGALGGTMVYEGTGSGTLTDARIQSDNPGMSLSPANTVFSAVTLSNGASCQRPGI